MARSRPSLAPRKSPIQARSALTVEAIFQATLQVLLEVGLQGLTTTRVADRAGVSVGTLYQYFPNKGALLSGTLQRHLRHVVEAVELACSQAKGLPLAEMAQQVVAAFVTAKFADTRASRALYAVAAEVDGAAVMTALSQRAQLALCGLLATAPGQRFADLPTVAGVWSGAMIGPVQALLEAQAPPAAVQAVQAQLVLLSCAYLQAAAG